MACTSLMLNRRVIYEEFDTIGRTIHLDSLPVHIERKELVWNKYGSYLVKQYNGLWFKAVKDPSDHDMYGNIRFQLKLKDLINFYNSRCYFYYIQCKDLGPRIVSTVLITEKSNEPHLKIDLTENKSPLWRNEVGVFHHAVFADNRPHVVEFIIESTNTMRTWLYKNCKRVVVNHGAANCEYDARCCHKYNRKQKDCPHDFSIERTENLINTRYPKFLDSRNNRTLQTFSQNRDTSVSEGENHFKNIAIGAAVVGGITVGVLGILSAIKSVNKHND